MSLDSKTFEEELSELVKKHVDKGEEKQSIVNTLEDKVTEIEDDAE